MARYLTHAFIIDKKKQNVFCAMIDLQYTFIRPSFLVNSEKNEIININEEIENNFFNFLIGVNKSSLECYEDFLDKDMKTALFERLMVDIDMSSDNFLKSIMLDYLNKSYENYLANDRRKMATMSYIIIDHAFIYEYDSDKKIIAPTHYKHFDIKEYMELIIDKGIDKINEILLEKSKDKDKVRENIEHKNNFISHWKTNITNNLQNNLVRLYKTRDAKQNESNEQYEYMKKNFKYNYVGSEEDIQICKDIEKYYKEKHFKDEIIKTFNGDIPKSIEDYLFNTKYNPFMALKKSKDLYYLINKAYELTIKNIQKTTDIKKRKEFFKDYGICVENFNDRLVKNTNLYYKDNFKYQMDFFQSRNWYLYDNGVFETLDLNVYSMTFNTASRFLSSFKEIFCKDCEEWNW